MEGTTYIYGEFRRTLGSVAVKKNGAAVGTPIGAYMEDGACIVISPKSLFEKLGYDTTENTKSYTLANKGDSSLPKLTIAKYEYGAATMSNVKVKTVNDTVKSQINSTLDWDENTKTATVSFNAAVVVPKDTKGREITFPDTIKGKLNGEDITLSPNKKWGAPGMGLYPKEVQKDAEGRYKIAVGPKIANKNYPDNGRIWTDYDGLVHGIKIDVVLSKGSETNTIKCVISDFKAHSYNKYPDGHEYNTGDIASFEIENGLLQTGIAYPNSWNASQNRACSPIDMNGTVIEFCCHELDFNPGDYTLVKVIVLEE